jgi:hypothetical protein
MTGFPHADYVGLRPLGWIVAWFGVSSIPYAPFCGYDDGTSAQPGAGSSIVRRAGCFGFAHLLPQER